MTHQHPVLYAIGLGYILLSAGVSNFVAIGIGIQELQKWWIEKGRSLWQDRYLPRLKSHWWKIRYGAEPCACKECRGKKRELSYDEIAKILKNLEEEGRITWEEYLKYRLASPMVLPPNYYVQDLCKTCNIVTSVPDDDLYPEMASE